LKRLKSSVVGVRSLFSSSKYSKLDSTVFLAGQIITMVTIYASKSTATCSPMIGHFCWYHDFSINQHRVVKMKIYINREVLETVLSLVKYESLVILIMRDKPLSFWGWVMGVLDTCLGHEIFSSPSGYACFFWWAKAY